MANSPEVEEPTREYPVASDDTAGSAAPAPIPAPAPVDSGPAAPERVRPSGFARLLIFTFFVFALMVATCLGLRAVHVLPGFSNPFSRRTTDRRQPVLM